MPAYQKLAKFLKDDYAPKGRTEVGIWSLPNGDAIYRFMVRESTTTDVDPEKIHEIGLQQVAEIEKQQLAIAQKLGYKDLKSFAASIATNPKLHAQSREQILDLYRKYIGQMEPKLPELFGHLPKAKLIVMPVEAYREKDASGAEYVEARPTARVPAT